LILVTFLLAPSLRAKDFVLGCGALFVAKGDEVVKLAVDSFFTLDFGVSPE
jgi:hypothetical protein